MERYACFCFSAPGGVSRGGGDGGEGGSSAGCSPLNTHTDIWLY